MKKTALCLAISLALLSWSKYTTANKLKILINDKSLALNNFDYRNALSLYKTFFEKPKTRQDILNLEERIKAQEWSLDKSPHKIFHSFADGMYRREMHIKSGHIIVGEIHRNDYFINVLKGRVWLTSEFYNKELIAPCSFTAPAGVKHIGFHLEDTVWTDTHKVTSTNIKDAEKEIFVNSYTELDISNNIIEYKEACRDIGFSEKQVYEASRIEIDLIPQPESSIEVKESDIDGLGVFSLKDFNTGDVIGTARIKNNRTPIGRYTNHSDNPNTKGSVIGDKAVILANKQITVGDELTMNYRESRTLAKIMDGKQ